MDINEYHDKFVESVESDRAINKIVNKWLGIFMMLIAIVSIVISVCEIIQKGFVHPGPFLFLYGITVGSLALLFLRNFIRLK